MMNALLRLFDSPNIAALLVLVLQAVQTHTSDATHLSYTHRHRDYRSGAVTWISRPRTECTSRDPNPKRTANLNPELQEAITKMITGNEAKGYLMKTQVSGASNVGKMDKMMCDESLDEETPDITPDTPIRDRAVCAFQYVQNFDPKRLPQTIPEVQCVCSRPTKGLILRRFPEVSCEPMVYDVPVLRFDNSCKKFTHSTERISLACVPVFGSHATNNARLDTSDGRKFPAEI